MGNSPSSAVDAKSTQSDIQGRQLANNPRLKDSRGIQPSAFNTACKSEHEASLKCIEEFYAQKDIQCKPLFDEYKECKRRELERQREERGSGW